MEGPGVRTREATFSLQWRNWRFILGGEYEGGGSNLISTTHTHSPMERNHMAAGDGRYGTLNCRMGQKGKRSSTLAPWYLLLLPLPRLRRMRGSPPSGACNGDRRQKTGDRRQINGGRLPCNRKSTTQPGGRWGRGKHTEQAVDHVCNVQGLTGGRLPLFF